MIEELAELEEKILAGTASDEDLERYKELRDSPEWTEWQREAREAARRELKAQGKI